MKSSTAKALILSDGKPGHFHQSIALCKHLELDYEICEVDIPTNLHRVLSYILDFLGIYSSFPFRTKSEISMADVVLSAGSRTYYANKTIAHRLSAKSLAILAPRGYRWNFDALVVPEYANPPEQDNVFPIPINISYMEEDWISERIDDFEARYTLKTEYSYKVGILIGGDNKAGKMDPNEISDQLDDIQAAHKDSEIWVTTSRRTPHSVEEDLKSRNFPFLHIFSEEPYNPIPAFIHLCDHLYVTTDSTSMISECVSSGNAKVSLINSTCSEKHQTMINNLKKLEVIGTSSNDKIAVDYTKLMELVGFEG